MREMPAQEVLGVWDRGRAAGGPVRRTLELLWLAGAAGSPNDPAALPVGERDAQLLAVYEDLFGRELAALVTCTTCGEELEVKVPVESVRTEPPARASEWHRIEGEAGAVEFRLPNSSDLLAVAAVRGVELRRLQLLERLVRREQRETEPHASLTEELAGTIERRMAELDPQAEIWLELRCDVCQTAFSSLFDIGSFLWAELDGWARRTLGEVHLLARGYGWSETSILRLDARRRQMYVEMLSQ